MVIVVNCITQTTPYTLKRYSSSFLFWNYTEWIRIVWVFGGTFINVLLISWQSTLMVGEIGIPAENHPLSYETDYIYSGLLLLEVSLCLLREVSWWWSYDSLILGQWLPITTEVVISFSGFGVVYLVHLIKFVDCYRSVVLSG